MPWGSLGHPDSIAKRQDWQSTLPTFTELCTRIWCTTISQYHNLWTPGPRELLALRYSAPDFTVHIKDRFLIPRNKSALKYWSQMLSICSRGWDYQELC